MDLSKLKFIYQKGDEYKVGKVIQRKADGNGKPIGKSHDNPILDTEEQRVQATKKSTNTNGCKLPTRSGCCRGVECRGSQLLPASGWSVALYH
jgi:hypothetical protein